MKTQSQTRDKGAITGTPTATKIMLIRHAEKPPGNPPPHGANTNGDHDKESLTIQGWQRAGALVVFFAPSLGPMQNSAIAKPATIYASKIGKDSESERPQETVTPLISKIGAGQNFAFSKGQEQAVGLSARAESGVVLICWEHEKIPAITQAFPVSPNSQPVPSQWPDGRYDVVWVFDLDSSTNSYLFSAQAQLLLSGDGPI
jgi:hypothetical protein